MALVRAVRGRATARPADLRAELVRLYSTRSRRGAEFTADLALIAVAEWLRRRAELPGVGARQSHTPVLNGTAYLIDPQDRQESP
jgi:hypothetical protein